MLIVVPGRYAPGIQELPCWQLPFDKDCQSFLLNCQRANFPQLYAQIHEFLCVVFNGDEVFILRKVLFACAFVRPFTKAAGGMAKIVGGFYLRGRNYFVDFQFEDKVVNFC